MTDTKPKPTLPPMTAVESTNVSHVGHNGTDLFVRFKSGGTYQYDKVPAEVHAGFLKEGVSPGGHFRNAVAGKFKHQKLDV